MSHAISPRQCVTVLGAGEAPKHADNGRIDLTYTGAVWSGPAAFEEAGVTPADIDYASIYDSFTITVLQTLEDLGFCEKGEGGRFVLDGALQAPFGRLPFNTDGGGLCNNHPANRGGHDQGHRGRPPAARRGEPGGAGARLRARARARHRRRDRDTDGQRHADPRTGGADDRRAAVTRCRT